MCPGNGQLVEITHQVAFKLRVRLRDRWGQYEFDNQQTAVHRNQGGAAVIENRAPTPVQNMFEHVHIGADGNRLGSICRQPLAPGGDLFVRAFAASTLASSHRTQQ
jgi:hypothetical protein